MVLALGWLGFQTWQSVHRFQDHCGHDAHEEGGHHDCEMCDWEAPIMELAVPVSIHFVCLQPVTEKPITFLIAHFQTTFLHCVGRGPPSVK